MAKKLTKLRFIAIRKLCEVEAVGGNVDGLTCIALQCGWRRGPDSKEKKQNLAMTVDNAKWMLGALESLLEKIEREGK